MQVIVAMPGKPAELREIDNDLKTLQSIVGGYISIVGGYIETVTGIFFTDLVMIVNEEGRLLGLPPNRLIEGHLIVGPIVFAKAGEEGELESVPEFAQQFIIDALNR